MPDARIVKGLKIITPVPDIHKMVLYAMRDELNRKFKVACPQIQVALINRITPFFETSKEYQAIVHGPLDAHIGIPKGEAKAWLDPIISIVRNGLEVNYTRVAVRGNYLTGKITVGVIVDGYADILNAPEAKIIADSGEELPWVKWLTIDGDQIIIADYDIRLGNYSNPKFNSRSGKAIMIEKAGGFWKIPPEYAGTARDNWLTRAITTASDAFTDMVGDVMQEKIENA